MAEVKMTGNCLKGSRPLLQFDPAFDTVPVYQLLKELFIQVSACSLFCLVNQLSYYCWQVFGSPKGHPKVKPFIDHVLSFFIADNRIWFRNYQIVYRTEDSKRVAAGSASAGASDPVLVEIGPRFVLNPIRIFEYAIFWA